MAGWMGSGKSTIAMAVGAATAAVVIDHDTTKSAIMAAGVTHPPAGAASYEVVFDLSRDLLGQGHSVVIDSPSAYEAIPNRGAAIATGAHVTYYFVERLFPNDVAADRVEHRDARRSQVSGAAHAAEVRASPHRIPHRPQEGVLLLDTTRPLDQCISDVLSYLATPGARGPAQAVLR